MNTERLIIILFMIMSITAFTMYSSHNKAETERIREKILLEAKMDAVNQALEDEFVDRILDSIANDRADSIVEQRLRLMNPYTE